MSDVGVQYRRVVELDDAAAVALAALVLHGLHEIQASGHGISWRARQDADALIAIGKEIATRGSAASPADAESGTEPELPSVTVDAMSSTEIAGRAKVSDSYVRRACRDGSLRSYAHLTSRGYRVETDAALRWIDAHGKGRTR
jgi:hypothetical protein